MLFPPLSRQQLCNDEDAEQMTCPICTDIFKTPKCHGMCGHVLCESCWLRCLHSSDTCPICRCELDTSSIRLDHGMRLYMSNVQIKCAYRKCYWKGRVQEYATHLTECAAKDLEEITVDGEKIRTLQWTVELQNAEIAELKKSNAFSTLKVQESRVMQNAQKEVMGRLQATITTQKKELREQMVVIRSKDKEVGQLVEQLNAKRKRAE